MSTAMSDANIPLIPPLANTPTHEREGHVVQLYKDDAFLIDVLGRFVGGALAVGDAAVLVATKAHRTGLQKSLSAHGLDITKATLQGRFVVLDAAETLPKLMVDGSVDEARFKELIGGVLTEVRKAVGKERRVAVFGELVALLWDEGKPQEAVRLEALWNDLAQSHSFSLLCAYPITGFKNEVHIQPFLIMCGQHSGVIPSESYLGLSTEEERLRSIAQLQQRAQALESELTLRQSEERFRLLVEAVQDYAIFMLDTTGKVASWNVGAQRIKGYKPEEIIGKHFSCFYPEEDVKSGKPQWELVVAEKEGRFEDEGWRLRKDGSRFWANVIITAVRDGSGKLLGFGKVTRDFTERIKTQIALQKEVAARREAQRELQNSEKSLRQLSLHLLRTQDEERRRIGRDLHDSLGQCLAVLKINLALVASGLGQKEGRIVQDLDQCVRLTEDAIKEVRTVSYLLYPPMLEEMGLRSAILWYLDGFSGRSGVKTTFDVHADIARLPRETELALFRVLQEGLANVHRHSGSQIAHVRLFIREGMCILEVEDEGEGIPQQLLDQSAQGWTGAPGVGVRGMNERMRQLGGKLELVPRQHGAMVRATVPATESPSGD